MGKGRACQPVDRDRGNIFIDMGGKFLLYKRKFQFHFWKKTHVPYRRPKRNKGREINGYLFCEDDANPQGKKD